MTDTRERPHLPPRQPRRLRPPSRAASSAWTGSAAWPRCSSCSTTSSSATGRAIRQSRSVLGGPDELRPVRSHHLHRAVRLLAGPRPGALRVAVQVDRGVCASTARRILPPYWAGLVFSLLVTWYVLAQPGWAVPDGKSVVVYGLLCKTPSRRDAPTGRSGRSPSKPSSTSCCRCCCSSNG
jgi:hypothetical protein